MDFDMLKGATAICQFEQYALLPEARRMTSFSRQEIITQFLRNSGFYLPARNPSIVQPEPRFHSVLDKDNRLPFCEGTLWTSYSVTDFTDEIHTFFIFTTCLVTPQFNKNIVKLIFSQDLPVSSVFKRPNIRLKCIQFLYLSRWIFLSNNSSQYRFASIHSSQLHYTFYPPRSSPLPCLHQKRVGL